jgi:uncharacterized protein YydD (DUF2326 family)
VTQKKDQGVSFSLFNLFSKPDITFAEALLAYMTVQCTQLSFFNKVFLSEREVLRKYYWFMESFLSENLVEGTVSRKK